MKPDYPICQKHGVLVDHERGYVSWTTWRDWRLVAANEALIQKVPAAAMVGTVCEWGIPACDVEFWLSIATGQRTMGEVN